MSDGGSKSGAGRGGSLPASAKITRAAPPAAAAARARAALTPFQLTLRHHRTYTRLRRFTLALSLLAVFGLPAWHLRARDAESAGQAASTGLSAVRHSGLPSTVPPILGPPGAIDVLGLELIDPLPLLTLAVTLGPTWALLWLSLPALLLVVFLGRFFCGWVCPYVPLIAASNAARGWLDKLGVPLLDLKLPRSTPFAVLAAVLIASALFGAQVAPLIYPPSLIGREAFHAIFYGGLGAGALVVAGAFAFDTFVSRAGFCRTVCPGGALYSALGTFSPVTVKLDKPKCTDCTACDVVCNLGQSPMTGRIDPGCERCGKCVAVCPTDALKMGFDFRRKP